MYNTRFVADLHLAHINIERITRENEERYLKYFGKYQIDNPSYFLPKEIKTTEDWNEFIIANWNSVVGDTDTTYVLGDIGLGNVENIVDCVKRLNGKIILIPGNHDTKLLNYIAEKPLDNLQLLCPNEKGFILLEDKTLVLSHFPVWSFEKHFQKSTQLYGHIHNNVEVNLALLSAQKECVQQGIPMKMYNVGCMAFGMFYKPQTLENIEKAYSQEGICFEQ